MKFLCEMSKTEQLKAHAQNLAAQRAMLVKAADAYRPAIERWIAESEAAVASLKG